MKKLRRDSFSSWRKAREVFWLKTRKECMMLKQHKMRQKMR